VTGLIIAGGKSRRLGIDKRFLDIGGRPCIQRVLDAYRGIFDEILIVADGTGVIECDGNVTQVGPGAMMYCAGNTLHGITNTGTTQMTFYWSKWLAKGFSS